MGEEKKEVYRKNIEEILKKKKKVALLSMQRIVGKLNFLTNAVPEGKLHVQGLLRWIRGVDRAKTRSMPPSERAVEDLELWFKAPHGTLKSSVAKGRISATLTTDASDEGLGYRIVVGEEVIEKSLPLTGNKSHINIRELQAVFEAIKAHKEFLSDRRVKIWSDNMTVVTLLRKGALSKVSVALEKLARETPQMCYDSRIRLAVRHIPGHLNAVTDHLSRQSLE